MFDAESEANLVGYVGAELSTKGCVLADYWGEGVFACEYLLTSQGEPLGILFQGGYKPIFYTSEWIVADNWVSAFSWW